MARLVKGHYVTPKTTPAWWQSGAYGTPRPRWEKPHYVDARGRWVPKPGTTKTTIKKKASTGLTMPGMYTPGTYSGGLSDEELARRAAALADSQIAARQAAIERQRAAAMWQAQRDAATYQALGSAQMGMIGQIPANIQAIRNTAGQAIAQYGNQVSAAQAQGLQGEQAANAAFAAAQTGGTPAAPPPAPDGGIPAPTGPGPAGPIGVNAQAAMAASAQMGGVLPAREQAEIGAASAAAATGMPAVVARATQDTVAMRMAQAASEDADFRQQLLDASYERGGIYQDALNNMYDLEDKKLGRFEAEEKRKQDAWELKYKVWADQQEYALKLRAQKAAETISGLDRAKKLADLNRTKALTAATKAQTKIAWAKLTNEQKRLALEATRVDLQKQGLTIRNNSQRLAVAKFNREGGRIDAPASKVAGHLVDRNGNAIKDANGKLIPVAKGAKAGGKGPTGGPAKAASMARSFRGQAKDKYGDPKPPNVSYQSAYKQILAEMIDRGYPQAQAAQIARQAVNGAYGPGVGGRPKTG